MEMVTPYVRDTEMIDRPRKAGENPKLSRCVVNRGVKNENVK